MDIENPFEFVKYLNFNKNKINELNAVGRDNKVGVNDNLPVKSLANNSSASNNFQLERNKQEEVIVEEVAHICCPVQASNSEKRKYSGCCKGCNGISDSASDSSDGEEVRGKSDDDFKQFAINQRMYSMQETCKFGKKCVVKTTIEEICEERKKLWGLEEQSAPTTKQRREIIKKLLSSQYDPCTNKFKYVIGNREVCEHAWLIILGIMTHFENARPTHQFKEIKDEIINPNKAADKEIEKAIKSNNILSRKQSKWDHAIAWIEYIASIYAECGYDQQNDGTLFLPYDSFSELFEEYENFYVKDNYAFPGESVTAKKEQFRKAWASLKLIKLRKAKGGFETCAVCNNLNDCLKNPKKKYSREQLEIFLRIKRAHLWQQSQERKDAEARKVKALQERDANGNPIAAYLEIDGYTEYKTKTPIQSKRKSKGDTKRLGNRVIGVIVACGEIDTQFVYSLNDLVSGGANIMIEVLRQAIYDLGKLLATMNCLIPKTLYLQMDNCGENKNKYMFAYLSTLIEHDKLDLIQVNFLIVGHTHTTIDQYFSVITKMICRQQFIGSPIALQELFQKCGNPAVNRAIDVYYDYKNYFDQIINTNLKKYQLPHVFQFRRLYNRAYCVHKPFSTSSEYLPKKPTVNVSEENLNLLAAEFRIEEFELFGGFETMIEKAIPENEKGKGYLEILKQKNSAVLNLMNNFNSLLEKLKDVSIDAMCESINQINAEAENGYQTSFDHNIIVRDAKGDRDDKNVTNTGMEILPEEIVESDSESNLEESTQRHNRYKQTIDHNARANFQREVTSKSTKTEGYIFWLDYTKVDSTWSNLTPTPINYYEEHEIKILAGSLRKAEEEDVSASAHVGQTDNNFKRSKAAKTIQSQLQIIVTASKDVLKKVSDGLFSVNKTNPNMRCDFGGGKILSLQEFEFYKLNSSAENILRNMKQKIDSSPKFQLFPDGLLSIEQKTELEERKRKRDEEHKENFVRLKSLMGGRTETVYHNTENPLVENVMNHQINPRAAPKRRKRGEPGEINASTQNDINSTCQVAECAGNGSLMCEDTECRIRCCDMHGPKHSQHSSHFLNSIEIVSQRTVTNETTAIASQAEKGKRGRKRKNGTD